MVWVWDGSWLTDRLKFVAPPRVEKAKFPAPTRNLFRRSGRLNVLDPSPAPHVVPMTVNNAAYIVRSTAAPLQTSHPVGSVAAANAMSIPVGLTDEPCAAPVLLHKAMSN